MKKIMTITVLMAMILLGGQRVMASGAGAGYGNYLVKELQEKGINSGSRENVDLFETEALKNHR